MAGILGSSFGGGKVGSAVVELLGDNTKLKQSFDEAKADAGAKLSALAGAVAVSSQLAANAYTAGQNKIRAETGLTGAALDRVIESYKRVGGSVSSSLDTTGEVIAKLTARTKLAGPALELVAKDLLQLSEIQGGDAAATTAETIDLFKRWQVATSEQATTLDFLFRASQNAGVPVADLISMASSGASAFQKFNIPLEDAIGIITKIERQGGDASKIITALNTAFARLAQTSDDPEAALEKIVSQIRNADSSAKAARIAIEAFGTKAGPVLAGSIRKGQLSVDQLVASLENGKATIAGTREETQTLGDRLAELRNHIIASVGPFAQQAAIIATVVAAIPPAIEGFRTYQEAVDAAASGSATFGQKVLTVGAQLGTIAGGLALLGAAANYASHEIDGSVSPAEGAAKALQNLDAALASGDITRAQARAQIAEFNKTIGSLPGGVKIAASELQNLGANAETAFNKLQAGIEPSIKDLRELALAQLALAGGLVGLKANALRAAEAQRTLSDARAREHHLLEVGKGDTDKYTQAVIDRKNAEIDAITTVLTLRSSVHELNKTNQETPGPLKDAIRVLKDAASQADLTKGETDRLIGSIGTLRNRYSDLPRTVTTSVKAEGVEEAAAKVSAYQRLIARTPRLVPTVFAPNIPGGGSGNPASGSNRPRPTPSPAPPPPKPPSLPEFTRGPSVIVPDGHRMMPRGGRGVGPSQAFDAETFAQVLRAVERSSGHGGREATVVQILVDGKMLERTVRLHAGVNKIHFSGTG